MWPDNSIDQTISRHVGVKRFLLAVALGYLEPSCPRGHVGRLLIVRGIGLLVMGRLEDGPPKITSTAAIPAYRHREG